MTNIYRQSLPSRTNRRKSALEQPQSDAKKQPRARLMIEDEAALIQFNDFTPDFMAPATTVISTREARLSNYQGKLILGSNAIHHRPLTLKIGLADKVGKSAHVGRPQSKQEGRKTSLNRQIGATKTEFADFIRPMTSKGQRSKLFNTERSQDLSARRRSLEREDKRDQRTTPEMQKPRNSFMASSACSSRKVSHSFKLDLATGIDTKFLSLFAN